MTPDEVSAKQASKKIDKELEKSRNEAQKEVKLLLLGTTPPPSLLFIIFLRHFICVSCRVICCRV